jgi:hypothetical protein
MHHKSFVNDRHEPLKIKRVPEKAKGRHLKYRPTTPEDWEEKFY